MKTVRRLLYRDIGSSVLFVALAFLSLFFFIDFVDQLDAIGRGGRSVWHVVLGALYELPGNLYELMPIAVLIGTIYSLAQLAQSSQYTILRTGGLGPWRALALLAALGAGFGALTFLVGDYLAPASERQAVLLKASTQGGLPLGPTGAWLKERRSGPDGEHNVSINVAAAGNAGSLNGVRIFEFDAQGALVQRIAAGEGRVEGDGRWLLRGVERTIWPTVAPRGDAADGPAASPVVRTERLPALTWQSTLPASVVAAAVLPPSTMTTGELWRYGSHLNAQEQAAQTHRIQFWKRALYPLACVVMVALALPFGYMHARAGSVSLKVFGGIMLGISFVLLNNVAGHLGVLRDWTPWIAAATPSGIYLALSLAAFAWLVRYR